MLDRNGPSKRYKILVLKVNCHSIPSAYPQHVHSIPSAASAHLPMHDPAAHRK